MKDFKVGDIAIITRLSVAAHEHGFALGEGVIINELGNNNWLSVEIQNLNGESRKSRHDKRWLRFPGSCPEYMKDFKNSQ